MRRVSDLLAPRQAAAVHPRPGRKKTPTRKNPFGLVLTPEPQDTPQLVRLHSDRVALTPYMCFDEAYFKTLESMQWNRDNGCVELIPIAVGLP